MIDSKSQVKTKENKTPHNNSEREQQPFGRALEPFRCLSRWRRESRLSFLHLLCCSGIIHPGNLSKCRWPTDRAPETVVSVKVSSRQDLSELMGGPQWSWLGVQSLAKGVWGPTAKVGSSGTEEGLAGSSRWRGFTGLLQEEVLSSPHTQVLKQDRPGNSLAVQLGLRALCQGSGLNPWSGIPQAAW